MAYFQLPSNWEDGGDSTHHQRFHFSPLLHHHKENIIQSPPATIHGPWDFPGSPVVKTSSSNAGGVSSIPGWAAKIPHDLRPKNQNIKQKQYCNKFNRDFKISPHQKKKKPLKKNKTQYMPLRLSILYTLMKL